jgi:hypothetical protein
MRHPPPRSLPARFARGGISWVSALLLAIAITVGYLGWTWVPVYLVHYEVKQVVHDYLNQAVRNTNDAMQVEKMVQKLASLDDLDVIDESGSPATIPTVQVAAADVVWERDMSDPPSLRIAFSYTRPVEYPLLGRWTQTTLSVDLTGDISPPNWGPAR